MMNTTSTQWVILDKSDGNVLCYDMEQKLHWRGSDYARSAKTFASRGEATDYITGNFERLRQNWDGLALGNLKAVLMSEVDSMQSVGVEDVDDEPARGGWLSRVKNTAVRGANLGVGMQAAKLVHTHAMTALKKAKMPSIVLNNQYFSQVVMVAAPVVLSVVAPIVADKLKIPDLVLRRIDDAATAAVALTVDELATLAGAYLKPLVRDLAKLRG